MAVLTAGCAGTDDGGDTTPTTAPTTSTPSPSTTSPPATPFAPEETTVSTTAAPTDAGEVVGVNPEIAAELARVAGTDEDGPFFMVNLLDFHDGDADYPPGSAFAGSTAEEADARYNEVIVPFLEQIGATPVFVADVEQSLIAGAVEWDRIGIVRYPSRAALLAMSSDPDFIAGSVHKDASLANTFAMVTDRIELPPFPEPDAASLPFPPSDDDQGFMMVHVIDFHDQAQYAPGEEPDDAPISGREAVDRYSANAGTTAAPLGIRPRGWFEVGGTLLGDHQRWEQVRLNEFPSFAAFEALTSDAHWAAGQFHRTAGINETYALVTRPLVFDPTFAEPAL